MHDRGMIKWMPFNSVVSSKEIINSILKNKSKINISYYQNGNINLINSYIKKIDFTYHKIYFENKTILFDQIVSLN